MFAPALVATSAGTIAVSLPMMGVIREAERQKTEAKLPKLPSVKETILEEAARRGDTPVRSSPSSGGAAIPTPTAATLTAAPSKATAATVTTATLTATSAAPTPPSTVTAATVTATARAAPSTAPTVTVTSAAPTKVAVTSMPKTANVSHARKPSDFGVRAVFRCVAAWFAAKPARIVKATAIATVSALALMELHTLYTNRTARQRLLRFDDSVCVQLYIAPRSPVAPSLSIPCVRVETFLRLARIPYSAHTVHDASLAPARTVPCIRYKGTCLGGAAAIVEHLTEVFKVPLDAHLRREAQAVGVAAVSTLVYTVQRGLARVVCVDHPHIIQSYLMETTHMSGFRLQWLLRRLRRGLLEQFQWTGYGSLNREQYEFQLLQDMQALESTIGKKKYLLSESPTSYDCAVYAALLPIVAMEEAADVNEPFDFVVHSEVLTNYVNRLTHIAFPDLDELVSLTKGEKRYEVVKG